MRRLQIKFPNQIRISGWDFGSSARAMNQMGGVISTQAELVKVINSTTERKSMSTKTTIKRIALVAVAALGFGMLSSVPSQAAVVNYSLTVDANDSILTGESATAVLTQNFYAGAARDSVTVQAVVRTNGQNAGGIRIALSDSSTSASSAGSASSTYPVFTSGALGTSVLDQLTIGSTGAQVDSVTAGSATAGRTVSATYSVTLYNVQVAGTYYVDFYSTDPTTGAATTSTPTTWTVTVAAQNKTATGASTVTLRQYSSGATTTAPFNGTAEGTDSTSVATKSSTRTTWDFAAYVMQKNATLTAAESITVSVAGEAYIQTGTTRTTVNAKALTVAATDTALGTVGTPVYIYSTGTAGSATITFTTTSGLALGTKTVTFTGNVTTLAVSSTYQPRTIVRAGGYTSDTLMYIKATDANGNAIRSGLTWGTVLSSDATVIASASVSSTYSSTYGGYAVTATSSTGSVSGKSATLTIRVVDPAVTTSTSYITITQALTLGGSIAKEVISLDKSGYDAGEAMVVTVTATDSLGNPVYDGAATPSLTANKALGGTLSLTGHGVASGYLNGKATSTVKDTDGTVLNTDGVFAPAAGGDFRLTGTSGNATADVITVTGSVVDGSSAATDAANEATDAANAATDAANAAAEAADAATAAAQDAQAAVAELATKVASLIAGIKAQITSLTNLVIKIQKKVKA
jgi:hypothetical protein